MKLKLKIKLLLALSVCITSTQAQTNTYQLKRPITGVTANWHKLKIPDDLYQKVNAGFEDLRIFGIQGKDTLEVPYLLKQRAEKIISKEVDFRPVNESETADGYFYTFQLNSAAIINQIALSFKETNFNWLVTLEGSNANTEWFTVLKDYRILSIKNNQTDYQFTKLSFPNSNYQYYRLRIKSPKKPGLLEALINKTDTIKGVYDNVKYQSYELKNDAKDKQTIIEVGLKNAVPIAFLKLNAQSDFDFYRPIRIEYATDSIKTEKGVQYNFATVYDGTISSLEKPEFNFSNVITNKLKITIANHDNKPLRLSGLELKGNVYELIARFDDLKANYALYYGKANAISPNYEIQNFENKIPLNLTSVDVGEEQKNSSYTVKIEKPLFENKLWLWSLMAVIIGLLGFFSFKMLKN
ncbi:MAG: hypothetical protein REI64_05070 [Pedobacter sp.]|uniref:hypothetical protein n=1 Tax=Pedobacter sp. TaxID=1411316 RepID=UPI002807CF30|nr:hypothetical protein [Pedobacter sp.]MDQ8004151.1 hypothetical protein [Pedobacter sp.]